MSDRRLPRSFNLNSVATAAEDDPSKEKTINPASGSKKPATKKRQPRVVSKKAVLKELPEEAAQRIDADTKPDALLTPADLADSLTPPPLSSVSKRRFRWSRLFFGALAGLVSLGIGLWVDQLIRDLFARQDWLGWLAIGLTAALIIAAMALVTRELWGLARLARIEHLRTDGAKAVIENNLAAARSVTDRLDDLYGSRPDTARGRAALAEHSNEIIDGKDLIHLAERDLLRPLDQQARALVMGSAKRVSIVTAVSPRALVDIGFVLVENTRLMRKIADLYGGRPGTFGFWRLARNVIGHLAVTGSIAVGDGLLQQLVGHGVAAKISTRLGEGVINGLLTARIGIAAIDVCRPLPFSDQHRPGIKDFMSELTSIASKKEKE